MFNDEDLPALLNLVTRYSRLWDEREQDKKLKAEVEARLNGYAEQFAKFKAAFSLYGLDTSVVGWSLKIKEKSGQDAYWEALRKAGRTIEGTDNASQGEQDAGSDEDGDPKLEAGATIRELVLERLKLAFPEGLKAADIRAHIEALRGTELHEKTVGMTLYRLSLDGAVSRTGRTWFFVPEAKNPGGDTPGLFNRDDKEGDEP
jgi:hypothetical protein